MEDGRVALVSGANRGIGREIVRQLAERGFTTILGSRDEEKGCAAAKGMGGEVRVRQLDVTDEKGIA
jgi:NAD(P)-dependent dehydrogenase (short-subunit alcohol dehydrogenase family)